MRTQDLISENERQMLEIEEAKQEKNYIYRVFDFINDVIYPKSENDTIGQVFKMLMNGYQFSQNQQYEFNEIQESVKHIKLYKNRNKNKQKKT